MRSFTKTRPPIQPSIPVGRPQIARFVDRLLTWCSRETPVADIDLDCQQHRPRTDTSLTDTIDPSFDHPIIQGYVSNDVAAGAHDDAKVGLLLDVGPAVKEVGERLIKQGANLILHRSWKRRLSEGLDQHRLAC